MGRLNNATGCGCIAHRIKRYRVALRVVDVDGGIDLYGPSSSCDTPEDVSARPSHWHCRAGMVDAAGEPGFRLGAARLPRVVLFPTDAETRLFPRAWHGLHRRPGRTFGREPHRQH